MTIFEGTGLLAIAIVLGIILYVYKHYNSEGKKLSSQETAVRNLKSSFLFFGVTVVFLISAFEFGNTSPVVPEKINNLEEVQKILIEQNRYFENLKSLFFLFVLYFMMILLPAIYSFAKTLISTQNKENIILEAKEQTNILGLRED